MVRRDPPPDDASRLVTVVPQVRVAPHPGLVEVLMEWFQATNEDGNPRDGGLCQAQPSRLPGIVFLQRVPHTQVNRVSTSGC